MPETIEDWARLIIGIAFIGFVVLVIGIIFHSLIVWLCLGLLAGILLLYPAMRNHLAKVDAQRRHQTQDYKIGQHELLMSKNKRPQLPPKSQQQQLMPEIKKPSTENPDVQHYVPPGLPPDFFL